MVLQRMQLSLTTKANSALQTSLERATLAKTVVYDLAAAGVTCRGWVSGPIFPRIPTWSMRRCWPEQRACESGEADRDCQPGRYKDEPSTEVRGVKRRGAHVNHECWGLNPTSWDAALRRSKQHATPRLNRRGVSLP